MDGWTCRYPDSVYLGSDFAPCDGSYGNYGWGAYGYGACASYGGYGTYGYGGYGWGYGSAADDATALYIAGDGNYIRHDEPLATGGWLPMRVEAKLRVRNWCDDHFIYLANADSATWKWDDERGQVKIAWNCNRLYVYDYPLSDQVNCAMRGEYRLSITVTKKTVSAQAVHQSGTCEASVTTSLGADFDELWFFFGADKDSWNMDGNSQSEYTMWRSLYIDPPPSAAPTDAVSSCAACSSTGDCDGGEFCQDAADGRVLAAAEDCLQDDCYCVRRSMATAADDDAEVCSCDGCFCSVVDCSTPTPTPSAAPSIRKPTPSPTVSTAAPTQSHAVSMTCSHSMSGFACSEFTSDEETSFVSAVASSSETVETHHVGDIECEDDATRRRARRAPLLTTDSVTLAYDITVPASDVDDSVDTAALHAQVEAELTASVSSGEFDLALATHAGEGSVLSSASSTGLGVTHHYSDDDDGEDDEGVNAASTGIVVGVLAAVVIAGLGAARAYQHHNKKKKGPQEGAQYAAAATCR